MPRCTNASWGLAWRNAGRLATSAAALLPAMARAVLWMGSAAIPMPWVHAALASACGLLVMLTVAVSSGVAAATAAPGSSAQPAKRAAVDSAIKTDPSVLLINCLQDG